MPAAIDATPEHIKDVNTRYHDVAAETYDAKWGIDFGPIGQAQVGAKMRKTLGYEPKRPFVNALEIGAGTGYFSLNLAQLGVIENVTATDISPGMLEALKSSADGLGVSVETVVCEAEELPFEDACFDLVFGHAVLHHIPDLKKAMAEFNRVLRPGGVVAFCGEPSRYGDRLAALPKRAGVLIAPLWRAAVGATAVGPEGAASSENHSIPEDIHKDHELESEVDVHAFDPVALRTFGESAGLDEVRVKGEELISNMYGWGLRTVESTAEPDEVPMAWRKFAFRSYIALQRLDSAVLEPNLPAQLFYNLLISARKPA